MKQQIIVTIEINGDDLDTNIVFEPSLMGDKDFEKATNEHKVIQNIAANMAGAMSKQFK